MAAKQNKGLGTGLGALFGNDDFNEEESELLYLPITKVEPRLEQPRNYFDEEALQELSESILQYGLIQPITVRKLESGYYQIIAGARRWRAARIAGLPRVPVVVKALSDAEAAAIALIENLQREDLNPMEEALGIKRLMDEFGLTQQEAADKLSKSRPAVANALRLLQLPEDCCELVADGTLSAGHARALLGLENKEMMYDIALSIAEKGLSVRETEKLVKTLNTPPKTKEKSEPVTHWHSEVALSLTQVLGRNVQITTAKGKGKTGGKIEFEFFDDDDLKKLAALFEE